MKRIAKSALFFVLALSWACSSEETPAEPAEPTEPTQEQPAEPTEETAKSKVTNDCVGAVSVDGEAKTIEVGKTTWELKGSTLKLTSKANGQVVMGAVTDIKEASEENKANLEEFVKWFKKQKVDLIVVAGDTGMEKADIEGALEVLAKAEVPVFNITGNREGQADYAAAMTSVTDKHKNVFDLNAIRRVDLPQADIVSLPGYYDVNYVHADDGCAYKKDDVAALGAVLDSADSPVVLVSHGGPKQKGGEGIDRTAEGANVGDETLAATMTEKKVPFGIFGNIHEAGGRATDLAGETVLPQGKPHDSLYLNPGPADGVRWEMNDETMSLGMAATLTIKDGKGSYEIHRIPDPEAKPQKGKKKGKRKGKRG